MLRDGRNVSTFPAAEVDDHRLAELMTGNRIEHRVTARQLEDRRPLLEIRGATRAGEFEDVTFTPHEGEVLGLIGLLGAGRTELALALFGMSRLDRGELAFAAVTVSLRRIRAPSRRVLPMSRRIGSRAA